MLTLFKNPPAKFNNTFWQTALDILSALFIFLFVYTALSKFIDFNSFKLTLHASPLITDKNIVIAWFIPLAELITATFLFIPGTRLLGLYSFLGLMSLFTIYLAYMLAFTPNRPCICGGVIKSMSWGHHLALNGLFIILSIIAIQIHNRSRAVPPAKEFNNINKIIAQ